MKGRIGFRTQTRQWRRACKTRAVGGLGGRWRMALEASSWSRGFVQTGAGVGADAFLLLFFCFFSSSPLLPSLFPPLSSYILTSPQYPSTLCPPHHYTVPLLPAIAALASRAHVGGGGITIPTNHGAYPIYALGAPGAGDPGGAGDGGSEARRGGGAGAEGGGAERGKGERREEGRGRRPRPRLLTAPPARLLFFARIQVGGRMGVPAHLARDRAAAGAVWAAAVAAGAGGGSGGPPIGPTQADIHEKNARPVVRFERQLESPSAGVAFVDEDEDEDAGGSGEGGGGGNEGGARWAAHAWRARLCRGYGGEAEGDLWASVEQAPPSPDASGRQGRGGAAPGRIGRVYELGSFAGLWCGTMLMPSEAPYNALLAVPGGAFPAGGLARDDFVAAARPVYMRIAEHHSFHPHTPLPPPPADSTTGEEGMREGWLPPGTRVVGIGGGRVEVRAAASSLSSEFALSPRRREEPAYEYETVVEGRVREGAHDVETCPGCARVQERERERRMRAMWAAEARGAYGGSPSASVEEEEEMADEDEEDEDGHSSVSQEYSSTSQGRASSSPRSQAHESTISSTEENSLEYDSTGPDADIDADWPEWGAPSWGTHRFDEGWESACDGVQDVVFSGGTDPSHGMAWHHYEYAGRVRPWDGLIGLVMRPRNRTLGLATYFISGRLVGRDTFEGTWQMASQDVLAPSWGGSVCFARGEE
ncbi:hypothetical protein B0H11DRAFT_2356455 [Mycena galericulata]|nr:hypothetical protein B0H11DRAFT_2356455 [Mycena galericulata]